MKGRLVIVSGPSGVGKDTVIEAWAKVNPLVERVVAATTRRPRAGERNDVDYHFLSEEEFQRWVREDAFLEHESVHGNWYGTPWASVEELLSKGKIAILKIDVQGAMRVMGKIPEVTSVFLLPPDGDVLQARIRDRGTDDPETIIKRLEKAKWETDFAAKYSHRVVNDALDSTVEQLEEILGSGRP